MPSKSRFVTIKQAADYFNVSPRTIRRMIADGELKAHRLGARSIRIDVESLERYTRKAPTLGAPSASSKGVAA